MTDVDGAAAVIDGSARRAPEGARDPGWVRASLDCCAITIVGVASSLLVSWLAMLTRGGSVPIVWQEVAALVVGHAVLAAWCYRRARRGRCDAERRLYSAPAIGVVAVVATAVAFGALTGSWAGGAAVALWMSALTGYLVWAIVYAAIVLWVLCRTRHHAHRRPPYRSTGGEDLAT